MVSKRHGCFLMVKAIGPTRISVTWPLCIPFFNEQQIPCGVSASNSSFGLAILFSVSFAFFFVNTEWKYHRFSDGVSP